MAGELPSPLEWTDGLSDTRFVFYQGRLQSQIHAGLYIGNHPFLTTTNELFVFDLPSVFTMQRESLWIYPELPEVQRHQPTTLTWKNIVIEYCQDWMFYLSSKIKSLYLGEALPRFISNGNAAYQTCYPRNESGSLKRFSIDSDQASLAQQSDKLAHCDRVLAMQQAYPENKNTVLYGVSRGAATTFSALAAHHQQYKNVKLCVLEAPFDSVEGIAQSMFKSQSCGSWLYKNNWIRQGILGKQHHAERAAQPRGHADYYPHNVPTVIVSSITDDVVPHKNTIRLALRVAIRRLQAKEAGEDISPMYFLQLDSQRHVRYCNTGTQDASRYQSFIHYLYRKHQLPHIEALAQQCTENEKITDLTSDLMAPLVKAQQKYWQNKLYRQTIRMDALTDFFKQLNHLQLKIMDEIRMIRFAKEMPLFSGLIEVPGLFFGKRAVGHDAVKSLAKRESELVAKLAVEPQPSSLQPST